MGEGLMQKVALIIIISFFSVFDLFPQVIIKERVEIKPEKYLSNTTSEEHTIIFNLQWDRPSVQAAVAGISIPCQSAGADWQYGGSISLTVDNARAGLYWFQPRVNQNPYDTTRFYYQLYFDGAIVRNDSAVLIGAFSSGSYPYFDVQYTPPLISDYSFNLLSNELCYKKFGELDIGTSNNCATGVSWNSSTTLINLTITSGQEFASFYHYDFSSYFPTVELFGDNIEVTPAELEDISLEQDSLFNGSNVKVNVQAEWGGVIKTDSATAYPASEYVVSAESYGVEEINTGDEVFMELNVLSNLSCSFCLPLNETYNAEIIKGGEYGSLIDPVSGESVQSLTGIEQYTFGPGQPCGVADLDYIADGISADMEDSVIIRISTSDSQIQPTDKLLLIKPSPVLVTITPDTLSPGDTASIAIKKRNPDGTIEDFPDDQFLEVGMLNNCIFGTIVDCYDGNCYQDTYFPDVLPTDSVYFVADSSADSGTVKIRVGIVDDGGIIGAGVAAQDRSARFKKIGKAKPKVAEKKNRSVEEKAAFIKDVKNRINSSALSISEKQKMVEKLNILASTNTEGSSCFIGSYIGITPANKNVIINNKPELIIIYPSSDSPDEKITDEPQMPKVTCKVEFVNYQVSQIKFEWEYWVGYTYLRRDKGWVPLCPRETQLEFRGDTYGYSYQVSNWEVPFIITTLDSVRIKAPLPERSNSPRYGGDCDEIITKATFINDGFDVFTGGYVYVKVIARDNNGKIIAFADINANKIRGINPTSEKILSEAGSNEIRAILSQESNLLQFTDNSSWPYGEDGWPKYGYPNGYGLMQLDNNPPAREDQLWNWKRNLEGGKAIYNRGVIYSEDYFNSRGLSTDSEEFKVNTFHLYNTGKFYYLWDKKNKKWIKNPKRINEYGQTVYNIYINLP
jgi:hypothetical protein